MKKAVLLLLIISNILFISCSSNEESNQGNNQEISPTPEDTFIRAADVSFLPQIESEGIVLKHNNTAEDALTTLKNAGCNAIRIRLWKNPSDGHSGLTEVKALALRVKNAGMKVWLTVHYSDTWADPENQTKPAEWASMNFADLKTSVATYTTTIINEIHPDIIQVGNETNDGMLWPEGKLTTNESQYLQLVQSATSTIRSISPTTKIMLHYAGNGAAASWYFNKVKSIDYDYIGLSYYPVWHGKVLADVSSTMTTLGQTYHKKVLIAETAYPFTLSWNDWTNNIVGLDSQLVPGYPATAEGQKNYVLAIKALVKQNTYGLGFCYWGGEWISFHGSQATNGSTFENQALWDFSNNSLSAMDAFSQN